jgi:hypothetical protein
MYSAALADSVRQPTYLSGEEHLSSTEKYMKELRRELLIKAVS